MSTLNQTFPTLLDLVKSKDPNGAHAKVVEALMQKTPILEDIPFKEGNLDTGHLITVRSGLPSIEWRRINKGYNASKGKTSQVTEACGSMVGKSVVDSKLVELNGGMVYRQSQDLAFTQAFKNEFETGLLYHSTKTAPEKFMGLSPRFDSLSSGLSNQIIAHDAAASGSDQASMWLVGWGPNSVYGITPKGAPGGLRFTDMGQQYVDDGSGATFRAYVGEWNWDVGLCVEDYRYIVRVCNIDTGNLVATNDDIIQSMIRAEEEKMFALDGDITPVWYVNRKMASFLRLQSRNAVKNSTLSLETFGGRKLLASNGIRIRRTDALLNTEAPLS